MFLLIRKKNNNSYHNTTALNSIMFLLIPLLKFTFPVIIKALNSIMFLLIRIQSILDAMEVGTLNSIMFLLIPEGHLNCFNWKAHFKFHYVSINSEFEKFFDQYMNEL